MSKALRPLTLRRVLANLHLEALQRLYKQGLVSQDQRDEDCQSAWVARLPVSVVPRRQEALDFHQVDFQEERLRQVLEEGEDLWQVVRRRALEDLHQDSVVRQVALLLDSNRRQASKVDLRDKEEASHPQDLEVARCLDELLKDLSFISKEFTTAHRHGPKKKRSAARLCAPAA